MKSDIEIAAKAKMLPITEIAGQLGIDSKHIVSYGKYKAKLSLSLLEELKSKANGHLILVTGITPTPAGEGKTTTTVGLAQALNKLGKKTSLGIREPSLGPIFGMKGGATGGGYSQVVPMEDINLHFTGDAHAVGIAHNLLAAMVDNSLQQGNPFSLDPRRITFRRVMDMNDRPLRNVIVGVGGVANGVMRESGFDITATSELMAIICLATDYKDLKSRIAKIVVGYTYDGKAVTASDVKADGPMSMLLKDAIRPNLVQTLENVPAFIHGGPFANIAHGCSSLVSTKLGLKLTDYFITEAGFATELGAEKFLDIVCREDNITPSAGVIVASVRALKMHGGVSLKDLGSENLPAITSGLENLEKHVENLTKFNLPVVVALNTFPTDTQNEIDAVMNLAKEKGIAIAISKVWEDGGDGGIELAKEVLKVCNNSISLNSMYELNEDPVDKITRIAKEMYGASKVEFAPKAKKDLKLIADNNYRDLYICMAKTQSSLSDNPKLLGRPKDFVITIREVRLSAGAGFIIPIAGDIMTMPGLPKVPAAVGMGIDDDGNAFGLF